MNTFEYYTNKLSMPERSHLYVWRNAYKSGNKLIQRNSLTVCTNLIKAEYRTYIEVLKLISI
ncbi:Uncharacterised protein [Escherichia coli]|nr:hypothetical protein BvCmsB5655_03524 [Escherichia coli]VVZ32183.1 Uncharacterised protein [Escherichia coli]VVZ33228.1 Uncharacterised protein [Escherichia coli]VWN20783.1 Uncharacterised protein [Escherichia coli]